MAMTREELIKAKHLHDATKVELERTYNLPPGSLVGVYRDHAHMEQIARQMAAARAAPPKPVAPPSRQPPPARGRQRRARPAATVRKATPTGDAAQRERITKLEDDIAQAEDAVKHLEEARVAHLEVEELEKKFLEEGAKSAAKRGDRRTALQLKLEAIHRDPSKRRR